MKTPLAILVLCLLFGCMIAPQPISFGKDNCEFCRMTIIDHKFGAELVTKKGKIYKFDSIECMENYLKQEHLDESAMVHVLVVDYLSDGNLINANSASFLKSEKLQSPMGAGLSAYVGKNEGEPMQQEYGGTWLTWNQLESGN